VSYIPLGGDGYTAPIAAYGINGMDTTGDASGGLVTQVVEMDNRYCSLVSYVTTAVQQATPADAETRQLINTVSGRGNPQLNFSADLVALAAAFTTEINNTWNPPAVILPGGSDVGRIQVGWVNVDTDSYFLHALIYLFDIRVRELTPMGPLLWARGST